MQFHNGSIGIRLLPTPENYEEIDEKLLPTFELFQLFPTFDAISALIRSLKNVENLNPNSIFNASCFENIKCSLAEKIAVQLQKVKDNRI